MPRMRKVKRIVDAIVTQRRFILHLECGHNITITEEELDKRPFALQRAETEHVYLCPECPDKPEEETPVEAFQKLFKE